MEKEVWKDIPGYEGRYQASTLGRIKGLPCCSRSVETILKPNIKKSGYLNVLLCQNGRVKTWRIHRLIAITFLPNPDNKPTVNHKNGRKDDNRLENLEWTTFSENTSHAYCVLGRKSKGGVARKPVKCVETGKKFISVREAERQTGISRQNIASSLKNGWRAGGLHWEKL